MKKSILILVAFSFFGLELNAQLLNEGSGKIFRNAGGADRGGSTGSSAVFGAQGDWSVDLVVSEQTPATAANNFLGPTHNGMGATGWGSFAAGAYNRASGAGAVAIGFHNVAGPLDSDESSIPTSGNSTNLGQFAVGYGTQATGDVAFSAGRGTTASGDYSTAMGYNTLANGTLSTAFGYQTDASGAYSTAIGSDTNASGDYSTAMGYNTMAIGNFSTAMGSNTIAQGDLSTAMGYDTTANGAMSTAFGYQTDAAGDYSIAMGIMSEAVGENSTAMGYNSIAVGENSTAIGRETAAVGVSSTALGRFTTAVDYASLVIGQYNSSGSSNGDSNGYSPSNTAFVIGNGTSSNSKSDAFKVMFNGNTTIGGNDLTIGDLSAFSGTFSQRSAIDVVAHADGDLMTGYISGSTGDRFNIELDANNSMAKISSGGGYDLTFSTEGGLMNFEGNGMDTATYAFDGNATVSDDLTVSGDVVVSSDARLKSNIASLGSTLSKLLLIDGKSYTMKKDGKQKIGVLAQDIQKVFPELVTEDNNEMLAVNYQGLVPVLINALKEQDEKISRLENLVEKLISKE